MLTRTLKSGIFAVISLLLTVLTFPGAFASSGGTINYTHTRILAIAISPGGTPAYEANGSGYLYSPRIVLTAGHFQDIGPNNNFFAFQSNSNLEKKPIFAKVVRAIYPSNYIRGIFANDFAVFVLDKPLGEIGKANLVTEEILQEFVSDKISVDVTGYGIYQDACSVLKQAAPCKIDTSVVPTSREPRTIQMTPLSLNEVTTTFGGGLQGLSSVSDHLFLQSDISISPCPGDSGGASTVQKDGLEYYIGTTPAGFWSGYNCGATPPGDSKFTLGYTAPVYKFLDLIKEAEDYVTSHPVEPSQSNAVKVPVIQTPNKAPSARKVLCKRGKTIKWFINQNGSCPKGYSRK
jgi:Trypsin